MKRRAFLISSTRDGGKADDGYSRILLWEAFLGSNHGGAWTPEEILRSDDWSRNDILNAVHSAPGLDYSLVIYAGHGGEVAAGLPWPEIRLALSTGESISEHELNCGSLRSTLILDCSQGAPVQQPAISSWEDSLLPKHREQSPSYRIAYEDAVMAAERGMVKVYADVSRGSVEGSPSFSQSILGNTAAWIARNKGLLFLNEGIALSADRDRAPVSVNRLEYVSAPRTHDFPLAVCLQ